MRKYDPEIERHLESMRRLREQTERLDKEVRDREREAKRQKDVEDARIDRERRNKLYEEQERNKKK